MTKIQNEKRQKDIKRRKDTKSMKRITGFQLLRPLDISAKPAKIVPKLTLGGLKGSQYVRVEHKRCSIMCGTPVQAILDHKRLTGLAGGVREGGNLPHNGLNLALEPSRGP